ncbi:tectonin beta-propeller repeat-containing protein [Schistocerca cancellata]|uniref:tectonin beta-propeller repeat-containing protein n=1 Tax=Schistocerca cancellata TaxID=274614 RepID=UPI0021194ED8|nr:tectonin beta-propeller repeat-containing protein [Schistocerca cancellata]
MPSSFLFAINNEGRVFRLSTSGTTWREFVYLGLEFKHLSAVPHFMWAVGGDRQIYVHVHGLDIPIRIKEESYQNERWLPVEGFTSRLLPTDRYHFSNQEGSVDRSFDKIRLPSMAWQWEGDWHIETTLDGQPLDDDGWTYAVDFPANFHAKKQWKSCVRRRKWVRYRRYSAMNSWCAVAPLHKDPTQEPFIDVSVGGQNVPGAAAGNLLVWAITAHGRVMFRTGVSTTAPEGQRWTAIPVPPGCEVNQISVGPTGLVWAVLWNGRALVRAGVTRENTTGEFWIEVAPPEEGKLSQVSVGTSAVWAVTRDHRVWFRKGIRGESCGVSEEAATGTGWVEMVGNMALVSVAPNDQVWAVGSEDRTIYFRTGVLPSDPTGRKWRAIQAPMQMSRTSSNASLWSGAGSSHRNSVCGSVTGGGGAKQRVRSWTSLAQRHSSSDTCGVLREWEETSRSAPTPTSLRLQQQQRSSNGAPSTATTSQDSISEASNLSTSVREQTRGLRSIVGKMLHNQSSRTISPERLAVFTNFASQWKWWTRSSQIRSEDDSNSADGNSGSFNTIAAIKEHTENSPSRLRVAGKSAGDVKSNPGVWSPIRSVGSVVGMEAHPESDGSVFDPDLSADSGVYGDDDAGEMYWSECDVVWCMVAAGACTVDPQCLPNWFVENLSTADLELSKPWRVRILQELKKRVPEEFNKYEKAVDISSWVKTGDARCMLKETNYQLEDCVLELEWIGGDLGTLESGTFTIMSPEKNQTKIQFSLSEITCIACCSEPAQPRIVIHTPGLTKSLAVVKLQFCGDTDMEDWMANLTYVCCQANGVHGAPSPGSIWAITGLGDIFVFDPINLEAAQQKDDFYVQEIDITGRGLPYEAQLHNGFCPGSELIVTGCVHDKADRFAVNLQYLSLAVRHKADLEAKDIAFHFNPRFSPDVVVRNSYLAGSWGEEEREGANPFRQGAEFTITIICCEDEYKVHVNGQHYVTYTHRQKPHFITHLYIHGDVSLTKFVYKSKKVIIDPLEMYWRQMGGHLRRVETCAAGVTWGVGYDNTAWVYTGGWGGSFLKGLETSSSGINPMADTHCFYVYENQRWNPLTGYTSHGLPTDRYMWSDSTGKHKRTREKTKLLSMHWQWVSEWSIDYHTPGGVDKEGWQYAVDFPSTYHGQKHFTDYVRRRRWVRKCRLSTSGPWQELGNTKLVDISLQDSGKIGSDHLIHVWAVAANGDAVYRRGVSQTSPSGTSWEHVPSDYPLASISCGPRGQVWAVGRNGSAYWRFGITDSNPTGAVWESVEPPAGKVLKQISVGSYAVWALDSQGQLSLRREVTPVFPEGTHWQTLPTSANDAATQDRIASGSTSSASTSGFRHVSAGRADGEVWAITASGVVSRRYGVTPENPAGTGWVHGIVGNWQHVSARGLNAASLMDK